MQSCICLFVVTICWSSEVVIFSVIPDDVSPFATMCTTSLVGAALLFACFAGRIIEAFKSDRMKLFKRVSFLSGLNATYNILGMVGLDYFNVSEGAFTFSMVVVVLPVMLLVMRRGVNSRTWASAIMVLAGICIAVLPTAEMSQVPGFAIMLATCSLRAIFIVKLNDYAREHDPVTLAAGMSGMNAVFSFIPWVIMQPGTFTALPWTPVFIAAVFIYGYFVVAFTISLNVFAQRNATPAQATVIYSTEIVFSVIWATCLPAGIIDPVELTLPTVLGCVLIVVGNIIEIVDVGARTKPTPQDHAVAEAVVEQPLDQETGIGVTLREKLEDPITAMYRRLQSPVIRRMGLFVALLVVYLVIAIPFKVMAVIPGFTDIRPVCMLEPVYGIFFGIPGCLAFAVGNLIGDIASDSLRWSSIAGFVGNFVYPYLMYLFWNKLRKEPFQLRTGRALALFVGTVIVCATVQMAIITPAVGFYYPDVDLFVFGASVLANGIVFPVVFAIPFIFLAQEEIGIRPLGYRMDYTSGLAERV